MKEIVKTIIRGEDSKFIQSQVYCQVGVLITAISILLLVLNYIIK